MKQTYQVITVLIILLNVYSFISESSLKYCTCNLIGGSCDVNCCCDEDCSSVDKAAFSSCRDDVTSETSKVCVSDTLLFSAQREFSLKGTGTGLFCISQDNYQLRNFYTTVQSAQTATSFDVLAKKYQKTSFKLKASKAISYSGTYKYNSPILLIFESNLIGFLSQPSRFSSEECDDASNAGFLRNSKNICTRTISDVATQCASEATWSMENYVSNFKVIAAPEDVKDLLLFTHESSSTGNVTKVEGAYNSASLISPVTESILCESDRNVIFKCPFTAVQAPSYDTTTDTCKNVVTKVKTTVTYSNSSLKIATFVIEFTLKDLKKTEMLFQQEHIINFRKDSTATVTQRSGNPGYRQGLPILAGMLLTDASTDKQAISISEEPSSWFTLVKSPMTGDCSSATERLPLKFGVNVRSGCFVSIKTAMSLDECKQIQEQVYALLTTGIPSHVAMFGNSDVNNVADWLTVINTKPSSTLSVDNGRCQNMVLGMNVEVLYSKAGFVGNAQKKIAGVWLQYAASQNLVFQCSGSACSSGTRKIEIVQSATFVDVSTTPQAKLKKKPSWEKKAPYDFFYPFS